MKSLFIIVAAMLVIAIACGSDSESMDKPSASADPAEVQAFEDGFGNLGYLPSKRILSDACEMYRASNYKTNLSDGEMLDLAGDLLGTQFYSSRDNSVALGYTVSAMSDHFSTANLKAYCEVDLASS